jgi:hypothetical protein
MRANMDARSKRLTKLLAAELDECFRTRGAPLFKFADASGWIAAIAYLLEHNRLSAAEYALRQFRRAFPDGRGAGRLGSVLDNLPLDGEPLEFEDDPTKDVQIVPCHGASTVFILFCGRAQKVGLPVNLMHRWIGRLNASLIYLRDFHHQVYLRGVQSLGPTREATVAELRRIVASLGGRRVVCYGNSAGVFGALRYGLDLDADAVACVGGSINLTPEFNSYLTSEALAQQLAAEFPGAALDPRQWYAAAAAPPQVRIVYGGDYWNDRLHAEYMGSLPCVTLQPLEGFNGHNAITELIARKRFDDLLRWLAPPQPE